MKVFILRLLWFFWVRGETCETCGFHRLTHHDIDVEFDLDHYPCDEYGGQFSYWWL